MSLSRVGTHYQELMTYLFNLMELRVFSKFEYHQVGISMLTFRIQYGLLVMQFRVTHAPAIFINLINRVFASDLDKFVVVIL